ncbi:TerB family tellurite resistance protein [Pseudooceanicola sp. C21-150M6]|uniref:tellurite resistance TerB family protein n=1 Tax=Pseudooceanicola sp. C21-150M6 TaxID=3434355 RepID=UPI003D7F99F1
MVSDLLSRLFGSAPPILPDSDARLALSALLVRVARSDGHYDSAERETIRAIVTRRYSLDAAAAGTLLAEAELMESEAPDTVRFTRAIKDAVPYEDRLGVIESLWEVVLADGARDPEEDALLRMAASLLGVTDQDSNAARLKVTKA